jgi:hypothetical protein
MKLLHCAEVASGGPKRPVDIRLRMGGGEEHVVRWVKVDVPSAMAAGQKANRLRRPGSSPNISICTGPVRRIAKPSRPLSASSPPRSRPPSRVMCATASSRSSVRMLAGLAATDTAAVETEPIET